MINYNKYIVLISIAFIIIFSSCEDVIDIELDDAPTQIVVDAWLNNLSETQTITINTTIPYFDSLSRNDITGAQVQVTRMDDNTVYTFEDQGDGSYLWTPSAGESLGTIGDNFSLEIVNGSERYSAATQLYRVPPVDSIGQEFREDDLSGPDGIYCNFFSRDLIGLNDTYWIKTFKNGVYLNKPEELNIAWDAGFDSGAQVDGFIFITPVRELVNEIPDTSDNRFAPYFPEDIIRVEIHSISNPAFSFLESARDQLLNANNGIFAEPIANTPGNINNENNSLEVLGVFNVAAISALEVTIE
jgi:hypothetical protein